MTTRNQVAQLDVQTIDSLRSANSTKANWLGAAPGFEIFGLAALTYSVYVILNAASRLDQRRLW